MAQAITTTPRRTPGVARVFAPVVFLLAALGIGLWFVAVPHDRPVDIQLIEAARAGDRAAAEAALRDGGNVNARVQVTLLDTLLGHHGEADLNYTPLHHAAINGRTEVVALLLSKGADINARTNVGSTPLMLAAQEAQKDVIEQLIQAGADLKATTENGKSASDFAIKRNQTKQYDDIVDLLVKAGVPEPVSRSK
jgi:ankyrin repeat protein